MSTASPPPPAPADELEADDGVLLRIPAPDDRWLEALPPAPYGAEVTVSLTDPRAAIRHAARLVELGYVPVGAAGAGADERWADFVAPRDVLDEDPAWRLRLTSDGMRVYDSALGPVRALLGPIFAAHRREPGPDETVGDGQPDQRDGTAQARSA